MITRRINGLQFENMVRNGLANLRSMEATVNSLNVFPVADGDTGTNLCLTLENGIQQAGSQGELGSYLRNLSHGMLLGARGNSGVILSQFFRGLYQELARCSTAGPGELRNGLIRGYRTAYAAMVQPVEGTILTVAREGIDRIRSRIDRNTTIEALFTMYVGEMKQSLARTPQLLPVLKEAGVVDSGAMGFIILVEGMLKCLEGEIIRVDAPAVEKPAYTVANPEFFHEDSIFEKGYCMEFILQLLRSSDYAQNFRVSRFVEELQGLGDSLAVVQEARRVKVHIHTKKPANVMRAAQEYGEFVSFKLENMQLQHNEHMSKLAAAGKESKPLAVVCVVNGEGMAQLFRDLGCDCVLDGGSTMNTSAQEFMDAFAQVHAENIVVLPNHKNNILAAEQAVRLCGRDQVHILPTKSFAEGYFAMAMDVQDSTDARYRMEQMRMGLENVTTLAQTTASRDYIYHEISCRAGEEIVLRNDHLVCVSQDWQTALVQAMRQVEDIFDKESCVIFRGRHGTEEQQWALEERLQEEFPQLEATFLDGGQDIYRWIVGIL